MSTGEPTGKGKGQAATARSGPLDPAQRDRHADLMEAVAGAQDRSAFAELFAFYAPRVKSYLVRLGSNSEQAEEIAQDVMVTVWRKASLFDRRQASVSTWIFRVARNRRIDVFRRSAKPELDPEDSMLLPAGVEAPGEGVEVRQIEDHVRRALAELPTEQAELLRLAYYEGFSHSEIAEKLGLPLGTVKSRIRLAFQKMRPRLPGDL